MQHSNRSGVSSCQAQVLRRHRVMSLAAMAAMAVPALLPMHADAQVSGSWKVTGGGNWSNVANWSGSGYPDAAGVATLGTAITAAATVNLDTNVSLSALQ